MLHKLQARDLRAFFGAFAITGIMLFAATGFVLVVSSYSTYGLERPDPPIELLSTADDIGLSVMGRRISLPKSALEQAVDFVLQRERIFIPRSLRLGAELCVLADNCLQIFMEN